ncbi:ROK family protein [Humibacter soli]
MRYSTGADRAELSRELGLPRPTVASAVQRLISAGVLVDVDARDGRPLVGRGRHLLETVGPSAAVGLVRWRGGRLLLGLYGANGDALDEPTSLEQPAPDVGPAGLEPAVEALVERASRLDAYELRLVVISVPAPFLRGRGAPLESSVDTGVAERFAITQPDDIDEYLGRRHPLAFISENDANLAALGERYVGGHGEANLVYVKLDGEGLGSALIVNGRLVRGSQGFAGELAHIQLDPDGPLCLCGGRGCLWNQVRDLALSVPGYGVDRPIGFADLPRLAAAGDPGAARILTDTGRALGRPLGHLCTMLDPDTIVLDGSLGPLAADLVLTGLRESLAIHTPPAIAHHVRVQVSELGSDAEVRGALEIPREAARSVRG